MIGRPLEIGTTFKILGEDEHLWMIISEPNLNPGQIVLVNFTSWQHIHDQTCIVNVGDHPYLATRSLVYYPEPIIKTLNNLLQSEKYGLLKYYPKLSESLLKRIQRGAITSKYIPTKARKIILEQFPQLADDLEI